MIDCGWPAQAATALEPAAAEEEIEAAEQLLGCHFPPAYRELLRCSNGLLVGGDYSLNLYSTAYLQERNVTYEVLEYGPDGWILIGDDGGGDGILLDCSSPEGAVYKLGLGSLQREDAEMLASRLSAWVDEGFNLPSAPQSDYPAKVDVWLVRPPTGGAKELVRLKQELNAPLSPREMQQCLKEPPCRILRDVGFWKYAKICARHNAIDPCLALTEVDRPDYPVPIPLPV